jgi:fermentation-respiration switch protein FrsA (DUF1100 family)
MKTSKAVKSVLAVGGLVGVLGTGRVFKNVIIRKKKERTDLVLPPEVVGGQERVRFWKNCNNWLNSRDSEKVSIQSFDGLKLVGEFFEGEGVPEATVLLVHGYRSTRRREYAAIAKFLIEAGYNVLMVDNRAHGESEGRYVGFGCLDREDCYRWTQYLDRRFEGKQDLFLHGISMGAATVLMTSSMNLPASVKGIIGDCGFTSPREEFIHVMKQDTHGFYSRLFLQLTSMICRQVAGYGFSDYSSAKCVAATKIPVFIIHGTSDDFVPTSMGKEIYQACASRKELWLTEGAGHAESYYLYKEEYEKRMLRFMERARKGEVHGQ